MSGKTWTQKYLEKYWTQNNFIPKELRIFSEAVKVSEFRETWTQKII